MNLIKNAELTNTEVETAFSQFLTAEVISPDGTKIGFRQTGRGPGLVIMHGGLRASQHYEQLAGALAEQFTVVIPDRRGRGLSGPAGEGYSYQKECEDLAVILEKTQARFVFGHSGGALFALEAALQLPIQKMVLYEPAVSIHGSLPLSWLPAYERAVARQDYAEAMVQIITGLPLNWMSRMPHWLLRPLFSLMLHGKEGPMIAELLATGAREAKESIRLDSMYGRYKDITAETLLLGGSKSPAFLLDVLPILAETIPNASMRLLAGLDHSGPDEDAPKVVAQACKAFLQNELN